LLITGEGVPKFSSAYSMTVEKIAKRVFRAGSERAEYHLPDEILHSVTGREGEC
jgi:hypothetical protein